MTKGKNIDNVVVNLKVYPILHYYYCERNDSLHVLAAVEDQYILMASGMSVLNTFKINNGAMKIWDYINEAKPMIASRGYIEIDKETYRMYMALQPSHRTWWGTVLDGLDDIAKKYGPSAWEREVLGKFKDD